MIEGAISSPRRYSTFIISYDTPAGQTIARRHYAVIRKFIPNARVIRITVANVGLPSSDKAL